MPNKIAVIGLGNTLRRDDAIGILVLGSLLDRCKREKVDYLDYGIASFDLLHRIKDYEKVLLIDGIEASLPYGELKIFRLFEAEYKIKGSITSSHELGLKDLFELCKNFKIKTEIYVAGIQVKDVLFGEGLSDEIKEALPEISRKVDEFIDVLRDTRQSCRSKR